MSKRRSWLFKQVERRAARSWAGLHPEDILGASAAMGRPSMRQQAPEKAVVSAPTMRREETTVPETRAGEGTGPGGPSMCRPGSWGASAAAALGSSSSISGSIGASAGLIYEEAELHG